MIANLLVRMTAFLYRKITIYSIRPATLIYLFLIMAYQAKGDDQVIIRITDPAPVCFPSTVDLTQPAITSGSTAGLVFTFYEDEMLTRIVPDPTKVGNGTYYVRGVREIPFGMVATMINVKVSVLPTVAISYDGTPFCSDNPGSQPITLIGTGNFTGGIFSSDAALVLNPVSGALTASGSAAGSHIITYSLAAVGGCPAVTDSTTVAIASPPANSDAGNAQSLCGVNSATLEGNIPSSGSGTWTLISGPNVPVFTNASLYNTTVTGLIPGTYVFRWSIVNGSCAPSVSDVNVTISNPPDPAIPGPAQNLCSVITTTMAGNQPTIGTCTWTVLSGPNTPSFTDNSLFNTTVTGMVPGVYVFQWSISNGACDLSSGTITVTNSAAPSTSAAGPDQNLCNEAAISMAGNSPANGSGLWTMISGPNTPLFNNASLYNSTVSGMVPGEYLFEWTISNGTCVASSDTVSVTNFVAPTTSGTGTAQDLCETLISNALGGNVPVTGTGLWSIVSGGTGTFSNSGSGSSTFTADTYGTYILRWTISNGTCTPATADIIVTFSQTPTTATVGLTQDKCGVLVSAALGGNTPAVGTGAWGILSGGTGTFSASGSGSSTFTADAYGDYVLRWTIRNGICTPSIADITVRFNQAPTTATAGAAQNHCGILASNGLGGNTPAVGTGTWSIVSGGTGTFSNSGSGNSTFTADSYGPYVLRWTITNTAACINTADVIVDFYQAPEAATVGPVQNLCGTLISNPLGGNSPGTGTGLWSIVSGGAGTFSNSGTGSSTFTADTYGTYVLRWTISNGTCTPATADITVTFSQAAVTATVGLTQDKCGVLVSEALGGNTPAVGTGTWSILSGGTGTFSASGSGSSTFTADAYGDYVLRWTISNGICTPSIADITVRFNQAPTTAIAGAAQNHCGILVSNGLGGNTPAVGTGTWSIVSGGTGTFSNSGSGNSTFTADSYGPYVLRWTITNTAACINTADVIVDFYQAPEAATVGPVQNLCGTLISNPLGGNSPGTGTGLWSIVSGGTGTFTAPAGGSSIFTADAYSTYVLRWSISNGTCTPNTSDITVDFRQSPTAATVGSAHNICGSMVSGALGGSIPTSGTGVWSIVSGGTGTFTSPGSGSSTFIADAYGSYVLHWAVSNGTCTEPGADIAVGFHPDPFPLAFSGTNATKAGVADGTIDATITGGTLPYNHLWTGPGSFTASSEDLTGLKFGVYSLNITDKNGCSQNDSFVVLDPPAANDEDINTIEQESVTFNLVLNDTDADGQIIPATIDLDPLTSGLQNSYNVANKGAFLVSGEGEVTFTAVANYIGSVNIQYVVNDNDGLLSNRGNISVNVALKNQPPIAAADHFTTAENNPANGNLFENDLDPEGKSLALESFTIGSTIYSPGTNVTIGDVGTIQVNRDGTFSFVPDQHYNGNIPLVTYSVVDIEGLAAKSDLILNVTPVNDPANAVTDNFVTKEHQKLEGNILINDFDIDGDEMKLNVTPVQGPAYGVLILGPNGDFTYQPKVDFIGNDSFKYRICDNGIPPICAEGTVMIIIEKDESCEVFVPNVFTPNADGAHDYFKIRCLYNYENPEIQILNRAGVLVFKKDHYGNTDYWGSEDQAFWNGRSEHKWNLINGELPVGTYYYILKLENGNVRTGFIFLGK